MNRKHLVAIATCAVALGLVACDRSPDRRPSETHVTSAATDHGGEGLDGGVQSQVGHSGHAAYDTAVDDARDASPFEPRNVAEPKDHGRDGAGNTQPSGVTHSPRR